MTRVELEKYLNKMVNIKLFDGTIIEGCLRKTHTELFSSNPNLYLPRNYYFVTKNVHSLECTSCIFRVSHITKFLLLG